MPLGKFDSAETLADLLRQNVERLDQQYPRQLRHAYRVKILTWLGTPPSQTASYEDVLAEMRKFSWSELHEIKRDYEEATGITPDNLYGNS